MNIDFECCLFTSISNDIVYFFSSFSTISSMRPGWILPSETRLTKAVLAISLLIGSKPDKMTASGVSSIIKSIP